MLRRPMVVESWQRVMRDPATTLTPFALFLFGFVIPIDPTLVAVMTIAIVALWLIRGRFRRVPILWKRSAVVRVSVILFGLLVLGLLYTPVDLPDSFTTLKKYRELLLVPVLMSLVDDRRERSIAMWGFVAAMLLTLAISFGEALGLYNVGRISEPTAFHHRIIYGAFLVFTMFWAAHRLLDDKTPRRWLWVPVILIGSFMILYATGSRTAYILYFAMALLFAWQRFSWRGLILGSVLIVVVVAVVMNTSPRFSGRVDRAVVSILEYDLDTADSPTGRRLEQWRRTVLAIGDAPVMGHGTGGYGAAVAPYARSEGFRAQPHNEFLLIAVQLGSVGFVAFIWLLVVQLRYARSLDPPDRYLGEGLVAAFGLVCLFNSSLLNSPEGHFWAFFAAMLFVPQERMPASSFGRVTGN